MVPMHQRSPAPYTPLRRRISPGVSSLQCYMVRQGMHQPSSIDLLHPVNHSRDCRRSILPMYECTVIPRASYDERRPVGVCGPHRCRVLVFDDRVCHRPRHFPHFLYQRPGVHRCHPRASGICGLCFPVAAGYRLPFLFFVRL